MRIMSADWVFAAEILQMQNKTWRKCNGGVGKMKYSGMCNG